MSKGEKDRGRRGKDFFFFRGQTLQQDMQKEEPLSPVGVTHALMVANLQKKKKCSPEPPKGVASQVGQSFPVPTY